MHTHLLLCGTEAAPPQGISFFQCLRYSKESLDIGVAVSNPWFHEKVVFPVIKFIVAFISLTTEPPVA